MVPSSVWRPLARRVCQKTSKSVPGLHSSGTVNSLLNICCAAVANNLLRIAGIGTTQTYQGLPIVSRNVLLSLLMPEELVERIMVERKRCDGCGRLFYGTPLIQGSLIEHLSQVNEPTALDAWFCSARCPELRLGYRPAIHTSEEQNSGIGEW